MSNLCLEIEDNYAEFIFLRNTNQTKGNQSKVMPEK